MKCPQCGSQNVSKEVDGKDIGGMPGVKYRVCESCGGATVVKNRKKNK